MKALRHFSQPRRWFNCHSRSHRAAGGDVQPSNVVPLGGRLSYSSVSAARMFVRRASGNVVDERQTHGVDRSRQRVDRFQIRVGELLVAVSAG